MKNDISKVIKEGFCIGCGICKVADNRISIISNSDGLYQANLNNIEEYDSLSNLCPFSSEINESHISDQLYSNLGNYDPHVGYYINVYIGYCCKESIRGNSSSGGMATWILSELFNEKLIDGVIHVGSVKDSDSLFEYSVSNNINDILKKSKSRYYPSELSEVLKKIKNQKGRFALVGVPCFIKALRLLQLHDQSYKKINFTFSLFCGGMRTKKYAHLLSNQFGVLSNNISTMDFRRKNKNGKSSRYSVEILDKQMNIYSSNKLTLYGMDYGDGFLKPKACDWCDDITGENADVSLGDAWLKGYVDDPKGTSILVTRNEAIERIIQKGIKTNKIIAKKGKVSDVRDSQLGNYRHRIDGMAARIFDYEKNNLWHPIKRVDKIGNNKNVKKYKIRQLLSERSHKNFFEYKNKPFLGVFIFIIKMLPLQIRNAIINRKLFLFLIKSMTIFMYLLKRKIVLLFKKIN